MKKNRRCKDCYWYDQCGQKEACEDYDPLDPDELAIEQYEKDLELRAEAYRDILREVGVLED